MTLINLTVPPQKNWFARRVFCAWLVLLLAPAAWAQTAAPIFVNLGNNTYNIPGNPPPPIVYTNFDNEGTFNIDFTTASTSEHNQFYENYYTLNYTNGENGVMTVNNPFPTNDLGLVLVSYNVGYKFDLGENYNSAPAGTFYNQGTIRCDSVVDGNNIFNEFGFSFFDQTGVGECLISATNIINPGNIEVGVNGGIIMAGQNVDLSRGVFTVEPLETFANSTAFGLTVSTPQTVLNISATGAVGTDTNGDWIPGLDLQANQALSSYPDYLYLSNSVAYIAAPVIDPNNASNVIIRAVFIQNNSPNAPASVYIDPAGIFNQAFGTEAGAGHVQWAGTITDPATGNVSTNYLYLSDNYVFGATTNVQVGLNGVPDNFSLVTSTTPLINATPTPAGFINGVFPYLFFTNPYAYFNGQIIPTTVATNVSTLNPNGTITNLGGRIQISANTLNLDNTIISGQNYMSVVASNDFEGSDGAQISSPYADINLSKADGRLSVSNLLESSILNWSGTLQAWSTRVTNVDATTGLTFDYRVMIVASQLTPTTAPWVKDLHLHATNSLIISDVLNVYNSLYFDAQSLTITTNGIGVGATSQMGGLNSYVPENLGPLQWPNLLFLTNNGTLISQGLLVLTNSGNFGAVINDGFIADNGLTIYATNFVNGGVISNGAGNLTVQSLTTTMTNGFIFANGSISIGANSLDTSNTYLQCLSLTLYPTNSLTDNGVTNGNVWVVGRTNATGGGGFALLNNPGKGDLLGTTISNICPVQNKLVANKWSGRDFGAVTNGYYNNAALGRLILDVQGNNSLITFTGTTGTSNALYVDSLEFRDSLTNGIYNSYNFTNWLALNTNITIYFAQAYVDGVSVAEKINEASVYSGENGGSVSNGVVVRPGRLRWVPAYAGYFSSTNFVVDGVTNTYNAALAQSPDIDSNGNGLANAYDPSPFFTPQQLNFSLALTNSPRPEALLTWDTIPLATNYVYFTSSLLTNRWTLFTNFTSTSVTGQAYPVTVADTNVLRGIRFYKVTVAPWLTYPF
jgi:hypothetical protein